MITIYSCLSKEVCFSSCFNPNQFTAAKVFNFLYKNTKCIIPTEEITKLNFSLESNEKMKAMRRLLTISKKDVDFVKSYIEKYYKSLSEDWVSSVFCRLKHKLLVIFI